MAYVNENHIDAYLPDGSYRKLDVRFAGVEKYKTQSRKEKRRREGGRPQVSFTNDKFYYDKDLNKAICPAGKQLYTAGTVISKIGLETHRFKGAVRDCAPCAHRKQCLQNPEKSKIRQLSLYKSTVDTVERRQIDRMQEKIDTEQGRHEYSRRMGIVEPVFGNITSTLGLDRFTLRDSKKVNIQWKLYTMVHNLLKVHRYGQWSEVTE